MVEKEEAREDYLRLVYELEEEGKGARSIDISHELGITKASVSEMLRKLAKQNLVSIKPYSRVFLTKQGRAEAEKLFDRHFILKSFLRKVLRHDEDKARHEAHKIEHALSHETARLIERMMENKPFEEPEAVFKPHPVYIG